jgi:hypothetical protein
LFKKQFATFVSEIADDLALVGLKAEDFITLTVNTSLLKKHQDILSASDSEIAKKIESAAATQDALVEEQKKLSEKLNEPQQKYQADVLALTQWQTALEVIEGSDTEPESLKGLQRRMVQIDELPTLLARQQTSRQQITRQIFLVLDEQRGAREALFAPLQQLIQSNALIREEYKLQFQAKLLGSPEGIATNLFSAIKQSKGELRGEDESFGAVRTRFEKYQFNSPADAVGFAEDMAAVLGESAEPHTTFQVFVR